MAHILRAKRSRNRARDFNLITARSLPQEAVVAVGLIVFLVSWALHGAIIEADKSLLPDVLEAYAWGQEFQLGYNQHPPFWAWVAGVWFLAFPATNASFNVLEALNATLGLWGAWRLIGLFAAGRTRHAATLLLVATPFYTFMAYKYNANTIFISLWPWTLFFFVRALDTLRWRDGFYFGVFAAASIMSKYYAITLLLSCGLSILFHQNGRRYLLSVSPWLSSAIIALLSAPHLAWLLTSDAPPVAFAMSLTGIGLPASLMFALRFIFAAALAHIMVVILALLSRPQSVPFAETGSLVPLPAWRIRFLAVLVFTPLLLTILFGAMLQLPIFISMSVGAFPLMPLFIMQFVPRLDVRRCFRVAGLAAITVTAVSLLSAPVARTVMGRTKTGPSFAEPRMELATRVTEIWRAEAGTPLRFVAAPARYAEAVSFYSPDHPSSLIDLDYRRSLWATPATVKRYGLLIACVHDDEVCQAKAKQHLAGDWKHRTVDIGRVIGTRRLPPVTFDIFAVLPSPV